MRIETRYVDEQGFERRSNDEQGRQNVQYRLIAETKVEQAILTQMYRTLKQQGQKLEFYGFTGFLPHRDAEEFSSITGLLFSVETDKSRS